MPKQHTIVPGQRFGRLVVVGQDLSASRGKQQRFWALRCDCGMYRSVPTVRLMSGKTRSCGCLRREVTIARLTTHGHARHKAETVEYKAWCGIIQRCGNPNATAYGDYGGRGITVDPRWLDFPTFLADVGPRPSPAYSVDRIDNALGYAPGNVRWATKSQQMENRRPRRNARSPEARKEYHRQWRMANPERARRWQTEHPERVRIVFRAANRVHRAVARGDLVKPDACEACGAVRKVCAAHADYARPLDVRWLCYSCHNRWDRAHPKSLP